MFVWITDDCWAELQRDIDVSAVLPQNHFSTAECVDSFEIDLTTQISKGWSWKALAMVIERRVGPNKIIGIVLERRVGPEMS